MISDRARVQQRARGSVLRLLLLGMFLGPTLGMAGSSSATVVGRDATLPKNICTAIGVDKAVAVKYFGKGAYPMNVTQYLPPTCDIDGPRGGQLISPSGVSTAGDVWVVLTLKTATVSTVAEWEKYDLSDSAGVKGTSLSGLGTGAVFFRSGHDPYIYFAAGKYFVEDFDAVGGGNYPISTYVPEAELLAFAHYIYKRLS